MLGVGKTFKEPVGGAQYGEAQFGTIDEGRDTFAMPLAGLAEEHGLNGTAGAQRFFNEADAFDPDEAAFGGQPAAQRHTKLLEPAIVAAGEEGGLPSGTNVTHGSAGHCLWLHNDRVACTWSYRHTSALQKSNHRGGLEHRRVAFYGTK